MARRATKKPLTPTTHPRRPRQSREPRQPRQQRHRQVSTCPVCMQRTAAKKMVSVLPVQEDSLRTCKECATELRRDLLMNAYMAAASPLEEAQECAANIEILLGVRLGALPIKVGCMHDEAGGHVDFKEDRFSAVPAVGFTGATPLDTQRLVNPPLGDCIGMPIDTTKPKEPVGVPSPNLNTNTDGFPPPEVKCDG